MLKNIPGINKDGSINVLIEIPMNSPPVKYELDKSSSLMFVDRFVQTSMFYPCNYGFIPNSHSKDGDPLDVLVITNFPVITGAVIKSKPIAILIMEDESGVDEKIIAVPTSKIDKSFEEIDDIDSLSNNWKEKITHFFEHYKDLEKGKWVKIKGWKGKSYALDIINNSIKQNYL
ncbi:MAG: inorganic diphosphatase [Rickettsia sp.]|nr:inorganic diphosphatase [Rickettsia sp.]